MNEEKAVLDFFAKPENLPLGLSVAAQVDEIREDLNSRFWRELKLRLDALFKQMAPEWKAEVIEDRNTSGVLVGLQCKLVDPQEIFILPVMEQQYIGGAWRIFFGLMWPGKPSPEQLALPAIMALKQMLIDAGFKDNDSFLAWQWTKFYPRRSDFLLRYSQQPEKLLDEVEALYRTLSLDQRALISKANTTLKDAPRSVAISLDQLRSKL